MRILLSSSMLALTAACASAPADDGFDRAGFVGAVPFEETEDYPVEIVETAVPLPLPGQLKKIDAAPPEPPVPPEEAIEQGRAHALMEPTVDGYVNAIQVYPYTEGALYRLYASPGQVSDIALQPGEDLVSVSAGDTVRWVVGDTLSGSGAEARAHVLVKPINAGIRTNLMIATDRRTYHLELESVASGYMAALSWRYPADELTRLAARNRDALARDAGTVERGLALDGLNFEYRLTGDDPDWKPVRVFDDGRQVFIQMPAGVTTTDMPPLFVLNDENDAELVNYRVRGTYYVVDRLFRAAELRLGEKPQTVVRIIRVERTASLGAGSKG
ncbi:P-type conjugative transfer protein TrbG [Hyphococcus luteus]|uniref:P-type conjugative transfer protein TrbG n=1 Tax=Hyphococcus luteus TaxID=2058213 RepID=A0A2S7K7A2_9PROT|nr:P-type conjugative transfer protein TrbG [Marinicaulis flavus]PQA88338.1 P-type conjugative transfer protein TrbG [Marinicaulis flavus]